MSCMKQESFREILLKKMSIKEEPTPEARIDLEAFASIPPLFQIRVEPIKKDLFKKYYKTKGPQTPIDTPVKPPHPEIPHFKMREEFVLTKQNLLSEDLSVWNLFEKIMGLESCEHMSRSSIMKAFRLYAKSHHPDVATSTTSLDFSYIVRVKNDMIRVFEKYKNREQRK